MDIKYIKDSNGNEFFPLVHEKGVVDNNGTTLENKLLGKQDIITNVNVNVDNNTGTPSGTASVSGNTFTLNLSNLKGAKGDTGSQGIQGPQGPKGDTGVTGDASSLAVIHGVDTTTSYATTDVCGADAAQALLNAIEGGFYY